MTRTWNQVKAVRLRILNAKAAELDKVIAARDAVKDVMISRLVSSEYSHTRYINDKLFKFERVEWVDPHFGDLYTEPLIIVRAYRFESGWGTHGPSQWIVIHQWGDYEN